MIELVHAVDIAPERIGGKAARLVQVINAGLQVKKALYTTLENLDRHS